MADRPERRRRKRLAHGKGVQLAERLLTRYVRVSRPGDALLSSYGEREREREREGGTHCADALVECGLYRERGRERGRVAVTVAERGDRRAPSAACGGGGFSRMKL